MAREFHFGHIPDSIDERDYKFQSYFKSIELPPSINLKELLLPVRDQKKLGACTAFAASALIEFVRNKQNLINWYASPLFTYYSTRKIQDTINSDSGATVRNVLKSIATDGVAKEDTWPYIVDNFTINPPQSAWDEAQEHQAIVYYSIEQTKENILGCLAEGYPFIFGAKLYDSFFRTQTGFMVHDVLPMPDLKLENLRGSHCMMAIGYYTEPNGSIKIIVRNSWGDDVGLNGYHNIPLEYFLDANLSSDFWTVRKAEYKENELKPVDPPKPSPITPPAPVTPPQPVQPDTPPEQPVKFWKNPSVYILLVFIIMILLFVLL